MSGPRRLKRNFKIVFIRHGESEWNQKNLFCGWYDAHLSENGVAEAKRAGQALKDADFRFDLVYTSVLSRTTETLEPILEILNQQHLPVVKTWRLNERHYGSLTGLDKTETAEKYGEEQVHLWRRSYDVAPPKMGRCHPYYCQIVNDERYKFGPPKALFPTHESLEMTVQRTLPFWHQAIVPQLLTGRRILIVAHGNSLRGIVKYLDSKSDEEIAALDIPTGIPFVYTLQSCDVLPIPGGSMNFLGDQDMCEAAMAAVRDQAKKH